MFPNEILIITKTSPPTIHRFCHNNDGDYNMYIWSDRSGWLRDKTWEGNSYVSREELEGFMKTGTVYELYAT